MPLFLPSGAPPGGSNTQVQFNDGGAFGGDAGLTYDKANDILGTTGGFRVPATGNAGAALINGQIIVSFDGLIAFGSGSNALGTTDVRLYRDAANTLAQRNGVNAQTFNLYETYTDGSNYRRLKILTGAAAPGVFLQGAGTGVNTDPLFISNQLAGGIIFNTDTVNRWLVNASGNLVAWNDNTYDIGASGATRPRDLWLGRDFSSGVGRYVSLLSVGGGNAAANLQSPANGILTLSNFSANDFVRLQFGGTTSSFPALKRNTTILQARLADDSAFAPLQGAIRVAANAVTGLTAGVLAALTNASIVITDASGQDYRIPCII